MLDQAGIDLDDISPVRIVGKLARWLNALNRCAPQGAAFTVKFEWTSGQVAKSSIFEISTQQAKSCIQAVLSRLRLRGSGQCAGTLLVGNHARATEAATALTFAVYLRDTKDDE